MTNEVEIYKNFNPSYMPHIQMARGYFPYQQIGEVYEPMKGLDVGTIFPELYKPYVDKSKYLMHQMGV